MLGGSSPPPGAPHQHLCSRPTLPEDLLGNIWATARTGRPQVGTAKAGTLGELIDRWLNDIGPHRCSYTIQEYRRLVSKTIVPALGKIRVDKITGRDLDGFYLALHQRGLSLVAPHLIDSEVVNALRRLVLQRQLTDDEGAAALDLFGAMEIVRYPSDWLRVRMWALRRNFTGQDATYIALAEMLGNVPLLTADVRIRDAPVALDCPVEVL